MPAKISSAITPHPFGNFSSCRIPNGLKISNNLKNTSATNAKIMLCGAYNKAMAIPATSSITTLLLSFPHKGSTTLEGLPPEHDIFKQLIKLQNTLRHMMGEDLITHLGLDYYQELVDSM